MPKYGFDVSVVIETDDEEKAEEIFNREFSKLSTEFLDIELQDGPDLIED